MEKKKQWLSYIEGCNASLLEQGTLRQTTTFIENAFGGIRLKGIDQPYTEHLYDVALLYINHVGYSFDEVLAALLHDVIEDTEYTKEEIRELYGDNVTDMVVRLSDVSIHENHKHKTRKVRKQLDLNHLLRQSNRVKEIKLCDTVSNIYYCSFHPGDFYRKVYIPEMKARLDRLEENPYIANTKIFKIARAELIKAEQSVNSKK